MKVFLPVASCDSLIFKFVYCPLGGSEIWSEEARLFVYEMTVGRVLQAQIYDYAVETGIPLVYLYSTFDDQVCFLSLP